MTWFTSPLMRDHVKVLPSPSWQFTSKMPGGIDSDTMNFSPVEMFSTTGTCRECPVTLYQRKPGPQLGKNGEGSEKRRNRLKRGT